MTTDLKACHCGPRECLHPSNLLPGFECKVAAQPLSSPLEEPSLLDICERIGYGRVMEIAAARWREKEPKWALTVGPCVAMLEADKTHVEQERDRLRAALSEIRAYADAKRDTTIANTADRALRTK